MADITPGTKVTVKIVNHPTNAAAVKTLVRLLSKDADVLTENARLRRIRKQQYNPQPRGGRLYAGHLVKQHPIKGKIGEQGTIVASVDVLTDLNSVKRFVEVSPA